MSKSVVYVLAILASSGTAWAQNAPRPAAVGSGSHMSSHSDRNAAAVEAKRVKVFSLTRRPVTIPEGFGLSLGRIKPMIDVRNDQLHYGR